MCTETPSQSLWTCEAEEVMGAELDFGLGLEFSVLKSFPLVSGELESQVGRLSPLMR